MRASTNLCHFLSQQNRKRYGVDILTGRCVKNVT